MGTSQHSANGHRKGTTSAFFLNAEWALRRSLITDQDRLQAEACNRMLRRQMVDIVRSNGVGDLFDWRDQDIAEICLEEMAKRGDEEVQGFDDDNQEALASGEVCGFTGEDLLPGAQDFGASAAQTAMSSHRSDAVLQEHLERQRGVRKGTFGAFCANYRLARTQPDPATTAAAAMMLELLPHVHQLGYLQWWVCCDAWAEALVAAGG
ncbi:hypothetical protein [Synechococcus sp. UW179A]|uniref:hypothetical protein n=1 Tax=Synechococcus sp. UW179A TaxID=2575510 RepID=UPI001A7E112D|nr:hypothetical protein [Synechococcus sp. UW179A]